MTVLKWLLALVLMGYFCDLVALFLLQRSLIFPIRQWDAPVLPPPAFPKLKSIS